MALPELPKNYIQFSFLKRSWKHSSTFLNFILRLGCILPQLLCGLSTGWIHVTSHSMADYSLEKSCPDLCNKRK